MCVRERERAACTVQCLELEVCVCVGEKKTERARRESECVRSKSNDIVVCVYACFDACVSA